MYLYHIISLIKLFLGMGILLIVYTSINVYEDPVFAIGLGFLGFFIAIWGGSFYLFLGIQNAFRRTCTKIRIFKDSYKLSLLFGIYAMINVLLLLGGYRTKLIGILLLIAFIILQMVLFADQRETDE